MGVCCGKAPAGRGQAGVQSSSVLLLKSPKNTSFSSDKIISSCSIKAIGFGLSYAVARQVVTFAGWVILQVVLDIPSKSSGF